MNAENVKNNSSIHNCKLYISVLHVPASDHIDSNLVDAKPLYTVYDEFIELGVGRWFKREFQ